MLLLFAIFAILFLSISVEKKIKILRQKNDEKKSQISLPIHYSYCFAVWSVIFIISLYFIDIKESLKFLIFILFLSFSLYLTKYFYQKNFNAKNHLELLLKSLMFLAALLGVVITIAIAISILFEAIKFFKIVNFFDFIFGKNWSVQDSVLENADISKSFGILPVISGTLVITAVAMFFAIPIGIMSAIYLSFYVSKKTRNYLKPIIEILAGIPTVVYGYFAVIFVAPFLKDSFGFFDIEIASESALGAGFVMGIMIIPFILSLCDDAFSATPKHLIDGSLALGSTNCEMITKVAIPHCLPSIISAIILAFSRAIGETMIVVMAAGLVANLSFNPLDSVTTATAQIVTLLVGDQEFDSPKTLAAFALALILFFITYCFNIIALIIMRKFRKL